MSPADDPRRFARLQELFHELVDLDDRQRRRRLESVQRDEPELVDDLLVLLGEGERSATMLEARERALEKFAQGPEAAVGGDDSSSLPGQPRIGETIGPYRLLRLLGEGGMGQVYEAEQLEPLMRRVALKVLRPGVASHDVLSRFDGERQALAVMDHPNIARILDAGATDDGRPWFAMELVDGVAINRWAETEGLDLEARIELLLPVCDAVQHAHLKGVIHRDLKPTNILVSRAEDGRAVPKVIDFGIAKAVDQPVLARTLATRFGELVGTPEYMSPEQASLGAMDVDTRSDVYSLGLVLYELLVGELPLPLEELRGLAFDEICRRIREHDTPRPSTRLPSAAGRSPSSRPTTATAWSRRVRNDLDAVVLKALARNRDRRYESVAALADDLRRFLRDEPVGAAPPSLGYRAAKLVRRHRLAAAVLAVAVLAVLAGLVGATVGLLRARRVEAAARAARAEAVTALATSEEATDFMVSLFEASDPRDDPGLDLTARELLDRGIERVDELGDAPRVQARLLESLGEVSWSLGAFDRAEELLERALELRAGDAPDPAREAAVLDRLGRLYRDRADNPRAEDAHRKAIAVLERAGLDETPLMAQVTNNLGIALSRQGRFEEAAAVLERSIALAGRLETEPSGQTATALANLGALCHRMDQPERSLAATRRSLSLFEQLVPPDHPNLAVLLVNIAVSSSALGELGEARRAAARAVEIDRAAFPPGHPEIADDLHGLGAVELRLGHFEAAEAAFREGLEILTAAVGEDNFRTTLHRASLGAVALAAGRPEKALGHLETVLAQLDRSDDPRAPRHAIGYLRQEALALRRLGRFDDAAAAVALGQRLVDELDHEVERPSFRLLGALVALDRGEDDRAERRFGEAMSLAGCEPDEPCLLDLADTGVLRAHWYARRGEVEVAFRTLGLAVDHTHWTAWMLDAPDLAALRRPALQARWRQVEQRLADRLHAALTAASSGDAPGDAAATAGPDSVPS